MRGFFVPPVLLCVLATATASAQPGCKLNVFPGKTAGKIGFVPAEKEEGIDWGLLQSAGSRWKGACGVGPRFGYGGDGAGYDSSWHIVPVDVVSASEMKAATNCAEAGRTSFKINRDAPSGCAKNLDLVYLHEMGHVLGIDDTVSAACSPQGSSPGSIMWQNALSPARPMPSPPRRAPLCGKPEA